MAPAATLRQRKSLSQRLGITPTDLDSFVSVARAHNLMAYLYETFPKAYWDSDELTTLALGICMLAQEAQTIEQIAALDENQFMEALPMLGAMDARHQSIRELWEPMLELDCDRRHANRRERLRALIQERLNGYQAPDDILEEGVALIQRPERRPQLTLGA